MRQQRYGWENDTSAGVTTCPTMRQERDIYLPHPSAEGYPGRRDTSRSNQLWISTVIMRQEKVNQGIGSPAETTWISSSVCWCILSAPPDTQEDIWEVGDMNERGEGKIGLTS